MVLVLVRDLDLVKLRRIAGVRRGGPRSCRPQVKARSSEPSLPSLSLDFRLNAASARKSVHRGATPLIDEPRNCWWNHHEGPWEICCVETWLEHNSLPSSGGIGAYRAFRGRSYHTWSDRLVSYE